MTLESTRRCMNAREGWLLIGIIWIASVIHVCAITLADPDLWGHTLYGLRAIDQGILPERADPFSYTAPGSYWVNHEWLTEFLYGWIWKNFEDVGLWCWRNAIVLALFGLWGLVRSRFRSVSLLLVEALSGAFVAWLVLWA